MFHHLKLGLENNKMCLKGICHSLGLVLYLQKNWTLGPFLVWRGWKLMHHTSTHMTAVIYFFPGCYMVSICWYCSVWFDGIEPPKSLLNGCWHAAWNRIPCVKQKTQMFCQMSNQHRHTLSNVQSTDSVHATWFGINGTPYTCVCVCVWDFQYVNEFGFICVCERQSTCICMVVLNNVPNGTS